jgi:shikimate kinase
MFELKKTVALVGMMGSGKSAIGKVVSSILDVPFRDADVEIERAAKLSIPEVFERHGEEFFRDKEDQVIKRLLHEKRCILATGGGAFINENIRTSIKEHSVSIWLNADVDTLWKRVKHKRSRPLLRTDNPRETLVNIYTDRFKTYSLADIIIDSNEKSSLEEMANLVIKSLLDRNDLIERA